MCTIHNPLSLISQQTLAHYQKNAEAFKAGTANHDVSQNIDALLRHIEAPAPFKILDFGCGPGRDLNTFCTRGHLPTGLDGTARFVEMARHTSGCDVWLQDFLDLKLPLHHFDGIFANAALFHIPKPELPRVLRQLHACLKPGGVLFSSNPHGDNMEGWNQGRFGAYHDLATWQDYLAAAGFSMLEYFYRPTGLPREQQPWLASVWRA